jgi:hypothetical protein
VQGVDHDNFDFFGLKVPKLVKKMEDDDISSDARAWKGHWAVFDGECDSYLSLFHQIIQPHAFALVDQLGNRAAWERPKV